MLRGGAEWNFKDPMKNFRWLMCMQAEEPHALPWFGAVQGFALVPPEGSLGNSGASGEMAALMVLSEGGQLMVHDLRTLQPSPLSLPFQELPPVTASAFAPGELPLAEVCCLPTPTMPGLITFGGHCSWDQGLVT